MTKSLARLAEAAFERHGDYESLVFDGTTFRSGKLFERATRLAGGLVELGVGPGDRVLVMMANCPEVSIAYQAIWRAGAVITPAVFLLPVEEVRHVLADSGARVAITTPEFVATVQAAAEGLEEAVTIVSTGADDGTTALASLEAAPAIAPIARADSDLAALLYTGGTTGRSRGVMLSHENWWVAGKAGHDAGFVPGINLSLTALPLSHSYGLLVTVVGFHAAEPGLAVLMRWFDPDGWLELD